MDERSERAAAATLWGIEPGYFDVYGERHEASAETLRRLVEALEAGGCRPASTAERPHPEPAYQGEGRRLWVLAVQLYAVRSRRNWGHGDFSDLAALLELVADAGGAGIGLNPLHALFYDRAGGNSPYSPSSRLFLNPLYIDVEALEEFRPDRQWAHEVARLRATELVDYPAVAALKLAALRAAYRNFMAQGRAARRDDFAAYRRERGEALARFAAFETLRARLSGSWPDWPQPWRTPAGPALQRLAETEADEIGFHAFLQWNAERQLGRCRDIAQARGLGVGLYLDTAIGVDAAGADAWIDQRAVLRSVSVGAPPDKFNPAGQDWGLTAYNPHGLIAENFEPFRQMLRAAMRHAGAIRIDHVLGLMRLFLIPHGLGAAAGAYLRLPFEAMLAVACDESRRWRCLVIGEDLGTVPEGFRDTLAAWGVWSYLVMLFERDATGAFKPPQQYPERAIATFGTHDLPTYAGWMSGDDLAMKRGIGLDPGESDDERRSARRALEAAVGEATGQALSFDAAIAFLAATPARLVSLAIEDVLELKDQVNVPGTVEQHPNWRRRWPLALEELADDQRLARAAAMLSRAGRGSRS
jgi:4-alpha-glucanotransferase